MRLMDALRGGNVRAFRTAAAARDAVAARGAGGSTPLMYAVLYGDAASMRLLLDRGADPNTRNDAGATALMWAVGDLEKTRLLVERGADLKAAGPLALALSFRSQCRFCAETLLKALDKTALTIAMLVASPPAGPSLATEMLLDLGADPGVTDHVAST